MQLLRTLVVGILLLLLPLPVLAYDVLVLQSLRERSYDEALRGVRRECAASMRTVVMSDYAEIDLTRLMREEHPRLIIAVGDRALEVAERQRNVPVLYMMALHAKVRPGAPVTGVWMMLDPQRYLSVFDSLGTRRVGVLYDPQRTGGYLKRAQVSARRSGIDLLAREVRSPKETVAVLESLRGKVDALWMLPDLTAVSTETTEAYFLFSQGERIPVVSFADAYLAMGGAVALSFDRYDIGRQLGGMAQSVLDGTAVEELPTQYPRRVLMKVNDGVLRRFKLAVPGGS
ncbi:ABC transporter substrate-binding protein [Geomonas limicola]|uniref:ABC transporter substrate-binding protein n=1 Tax=Geomonas limicola TaxID=2740186 RepID=A0A6V8NBA3_9BACT|nr:ABC transporter substrate binding protein [Geomonas limicola]GFO69720.1 ABC transporter substrate-binding protein [Geomonas limicola]